jgi:hypothetical protein
VSATVVLRAYQGQTGRWDTVEIDLRSTDGAAFTFRIRSKSSAILPLAVAAELAFRLYPDPIVDGVADPLLAAKVSLGGLHRDVTK